MAISPQLDDASTLRPIIASTSPALRPGGDAALHPRDAVARVGDLELRGGDLGGDRLLLDELSARAGLVALDQRRLRRRLERVGRFLQRFDEILLRLQRVLVSCRPPASCRSRATACAAACTSLPRPIRSSDACSRAAACRARRGRRQFARPDRAERAAEQATKDRAADRIRRRRRPSRSWRVTRGARALNGGRSGRMSEEVRGRHGGHRQAITWLQQRRQL